MNQGRNFCKITCSKVQAFPRKFLRRQRRTPETSFHNKVLGKYYTWIPSHREHKSDFQSETINPNLIVCCHFRISQTQVVILNWRQYHHNMKVLKLNLFNPTEKIKARTSDRPKGIQDTRRIDLKIWMISQIIVGWG